MSPEERKEYMKKYKDEHPHKKRIWRDEHPEYRAKQKERQARRRKAGLKRSSSKPSNYMDSKINDQI